MEGIDALPRRATRYAGYTRFEVKEVCTWDYGVSDFNVMTASALKPGDVPGVFDLPIIPRQDKTSDDCEPAVVEQRFAAVGRFARANIHSECTQAGEGQRPIDSPMAPSFSAVPAGWVEPAMIVSGPFS